MITTAPKRKRSEKPDTSGGKKNDRADTGNGNRQRIIKSLLIPAVTPLPKRADTLPIRASRASLQKVIFLFIPVIIYFILQKTVRRKLRRFFALQKYTKKIEIITVCVKKISVCVNFL
jgi:hypothetical protein